MPPKNRSTHRDPIEAIRFRMEQKEMTPKDLVPMIGRINRVYDDLSLFGIDLQFLQ